jgi:hypothetical protein
MESLALLLAVVHWDHQQQSYDFRLLSVAQLVQPLSIAPFLEQFQKCISEWMTFKALCYSHESTKDDDYIQRIDKRCDSTDVDMLCDSHRDSFLESHL